MPTYHIFRKAPAGAQQQAGATANEAVLALARAQKLAPGKFYALPVGAIETIEIEATTDYRIKPPT